VGVKLVQALCYRPDGECGGKVGSGIVLQAGRGMWW